MNISRVNRYIRTSAERSFAEMPETSLDASTVRDICKTSALEWAIRDLIRMFDYDDPKKQLESLLTYWDEQSEAWEQEQDRVRHEADECAAALLEEVLP